MTADNSISDPERTGRIARLARFEQRFGRSGRLLRAPGRVNLIGEHTDYNHGLVLPMNTGLYTHLVLAPRQDRKLHAYAASVDQHALIDLDGPCPDTSWMRYIWGAAHMTEAQGLALPGFDLLIEGDLPLGGGLSSSASLLSALVLGFTESLQQSVSPVAIARLVQRIENEVIGVQAGIMDPFVINCCPRAHALLLDCHDLTHDSYPWPDHWPLLLIDSGVRHELADGAYNQRRQQCQAAAHALGIDSLRAMDAAQLATLAGTLVGQRARHVHAENQRVRDATHCLKNGDVYGLGQLLDASHASLRDDFDVSCPELDSLVALAQATPGVLGARMVGGGFGGCVLVLLDPDRASAAEQHLLAELVQQQGAVPWHHRVAPADPAGVYPR